MGRCSRWLGGSARYGKTIAHSIVGLLIVASFVSLSPGHSADTHSSSTLGMDTHLDWAPVTSGLPADREYYGVRFGDVNNDGNLDVAAQGGGTHVYVGDGTGSFVEQSSGLPLFGGTVDLILADLNNDGNLDIVGDQVFLGNGGAGGSMSWTADATPGSWNALAAADVNLDGKMDLIAGTSSGVRVWTGNGGAGGSIVWTDSSVGLPNSGSFWGVAVGDINHDGKPDVVAADSLNGTKAWTGNGMAGPASNWTDAYTGTGLPTTGRYANVDLGDVNNDGNLDIVATAFYTANGVRVWLGNGGTGGNMVWTENSAGLDTSTDNYLGVSLQDIDNDGDLDIFAAKYQGGGLSVWLGDGGAGGSMDWAQASGGLPSGNYIDVDAGDFNNDGKVDFVASHAGGVEIWENERPEFLITGYVEISTGLPTSSRWADVVFEDVNNNGKLDVGFTGFQNAQMGLRVFLGDGNGNWANSSSGLPTSGGYGGMRFDDLNHDGSQDMISAGLSGSVGMDVWSGDGSGVWTQEASATMLFGGGLEKGDLNNDGDMDFATGYYSNNWGPMIFLGDGNFGWSSDEGPPASTMNVDDVAIGDVNHDGKLDFAASSMDSIGVQLWTGNGSGLADSWIRNDTGLPTTGVYLGLAFGDVNHDGNLDLAAAGFGSAQGMHVYTGNGGSGGSITWEANSSGLPTTGGYGGVELCDLDVDGNLDIVYAADWGGAEGIGVRMGNGGAGGIMNWSDPSFPGLPTIGEYWGIACGDVDNDGLPEIGAAKDGGVEVWKPIFELVSAPTVNIMAPDGLRDWSGNSTHDIVWNMSDLKDSNDQLTVYINFSYGGGSMGGSIAGPLLGGPNPNTYSWTTPFLNATDVAINVTVIDADGYASFDEALVPVIDSKSPEVLATVPSGGQSSVALNQDITIVFDESMNITSDSYITATPDPGGWLWTWSTTTYDNDTLTGSHSDFAEGQFYEISIGTGAKDDSDPGNPLYGEYRWNFTTVLIGAIPSCSILLPIGAESWTGNTLHTIEWWMADDLTANENLDVYLNYTSSAGSGSIAALTPSGMASPPFTYTWNVDAIDADDVVIGLTVVDGNGFIATNTSAQFEVDSTPPAVLSTVPLDGSSNIARNPNVQATWSEAMDATSTEGAFSLVDNMTRTLVPGTFSWVGDTIVFVPSVLLNPDEWYTANFTDQARDDSDPGNTGSQFSWSFRTTGMVDNLPPNITQLSVEPTPQEVFNEVNISANVTDDFGLESVAVNITWLGAFWTNESMAPASDGFFYSNRSYFLVGTYSFTIWARDTSGNWNSTSGVIEIVDSTPPTLTHISVGQLQVDEPVNLTVTVVDNYLLSSVRINYTDTSGVVRNESMNQLNGDDYVFEIEAQPQTGTIIYFFWAIDGSGNEARSSIYSIEVVQTVPLPPENLTVTPNVRGALLLEWDAPTRNEDGTSLTNLRGYNIYRMTESGGSRVQVNAELVQSTMFLDVDLGDGRTYYYVIRAVNSRGLESGDSDEASGTTAKPRVEDYTWVILLIIMIVIAIVLIALYVRRRRDGESEAAGEAPTIEEPQSEQI